MTSDSLLNRSQFGATPELRTQPPITLVLLLVVLALAAIRFYRSATSAADLITTPDEVEYVSGAVSLANGHGYRVDFAGRRLPSQYPPAFSMMLAPVYRLFPGRLGVGIYVDLAFGLAAVTCAFAIGFTLAGPAAAMLAGLAVTVQPAIAASARVIMSDMPSLALGLLVLLLLIRAQDQRRRWLLAAAVGGAAAALLRPFNAFFLLPVVFAAMRRSAPPRERVGLLIVTLVIAAMPVAVALIYNHHTFGDATRDGYKFWVAVPYDYLWLEFSLRYLRINFEVLKEHTVLVTAAAGALAFGAAICTHSLRVRPSWSRFIVFTLFGPLPMTMAYAVYFFPTHRMHLPMLAMCCIAAASIGVVGARRWLSPVVSRGVFAIAVIGLIGVGVQGKRVSTDGYSRVTAAAAINAKTPASSLVISTLDPVYFSLAADPQDARHYQPLSDATPIAIFLMTPHRVPHPDPAPTSANDIACPGLIHGGAKRLFDTSPEAILSAIADASAAHQPVFLDLSQAAGFNEPVVDLLMRRFKWKVVDTTTHLYELDESPSEYLPRMQRP